MILVPLVGDFGFGSNMGTSSFHLIFTIDTLDYMFLYGGVQLGFFLLSAYKSEP